MEKMLTSDVSKLIVLLGLGVISMTVFLAKMISKVRGSFKPHKKPTLLYLLGTLLLFGIVASTALLREHTPILTFLVIYQFIFFGLGIVHVLYMPSYLKWTGDQKSTGLELLFTIIAALLGSIAFVFVFQYFDKGGFEFYMAGSILFFLLPWFLHQSFKKAIAIPPEIRKQWHYPVKEEIEEPDESKLKNLLVISFEFVKKNGDVHYTNFRAKAPVDMEFGELFYYFINDYNERHSNDRIQVINGSGEPQGWVFYKKPKWYTVKTDYVDAEKTIYNNHIRENDVIICNRPLN